MATVAVVPSDDLGMLEERLTQGDVAALILEPSGGSWATIPLIEGYLQAARDLTAKYGVVLIFDEVITGFRWAPGGAQQRYGVTPDLTTMAKIVAGGMPGGAVAGRREIMEMLAFKDEPGWNAMKKVRHRAPTTPARSSRRRGLPVCKRLPTRTCKPPAMTLPRACAPGSTRRLSSAACRAIPGAKARSSTSAWARLYRIRPEATCACPRASRPRLSKRADTDA